MFYVHKNNGQEIKEKVSFSDDSLIRDSLSSNYTLSIYKSMTETQKELVDKYLSESYPNGLDDLGLEEFMKFEVEQLLKSKGEYLIYKGFLSFDDKKALDNYIEEIIENKESIKNALNNLLEDGWTIKSLEPVSELTDKLEKIIFAIEHLKEADEENYEYKKDDLDAWVNETLEYITNSADPDTQKDKNFTGVDFLNALNLMQIEYLKDDGSVDYIDEVAYDNKKEIMNSCDFLVNFALKELLNFEMKGKEQDEILYIKDYVQDAEALKDFKKYLDNHRDEPYNTSEDLLQYFESSERERYIQKDLMSSFADWNVRDKHLLDRLYFELYSDSKHKKGEWNAYTNQKASTIINTGYDSPCECNVVALEIDGNDYVGVQFATNVISSWGMQGSENWTDWVFFKGTVDELCANNEMFLTSYECIKENLVYIISDVYNNEFFEINGHLDENEQYDQIEEAVNNIDFDEIKAYYDEQYLEEIVLPKVIEQVKEIEKMSEEEKENQEIFKQKVK